MAKQTVEAVLPSAGNDQLPPGVIAQAEAVASNHANDAQPPSADQVSDNRQQISENQEKKRNPALGIHSDHARRIGDETGSNSGGTAAELFYEPPVEDAPPPAYSETYGLVDMTQAGLNTRANVASDGRVNININQKSHALSDLLAPALRSQLDLQHVESTPERPPGHVPATLGSLSEQPPTPSMNIVIHVVGSRGDVQPFVALGKVLKATYGHRVRLATHPVFRSFIQENGLEFFSIGGDPAELMAFMVKNPGLMPGKDALRSGDIGKRRKGMYEIIRGCWRSCFEAGDGTGVEVSDETANYNDRLDSAVSSTEIAAESPFVADAIIANPPSFAHIHCAEKLGIPLHLMFTMPWSPTQAFPHPLANIQSSNADVSMTNFISYALVEMMTWQGLGDIINRFREKSLGLEPMSLMWAPGMASRLRIPYTYCWSPALIPKPKDWGSHISVSGFYFLSLASNYTPPADLAAFLEAKPPPIYIGFGSIVLDDPDAMTKLIFEAVKISGQRALVSKGWGGFGADTMGIPEGVFMLGNVPHDWLFKHVSCVVHHGGAGTTAAGIALGKPTVVVPFFGDQPFWGAMVAKAGAGPTPISNKQLTARKLADAIMEALKPTAQQRAEELGNRIRSEKGCDIGAQSFHNAINFDNLRCSLVPGHVAVWRVKRTNLRLSAFAAAVLGNEGLLDFNDLKMYRSKEYDAEDGPMEPITGGATALIGTLGSLMMGVADFPIEIFKILSKGSSEEPKTDNVSVTPASTNSSKTNVASVQSDITSEILTSSETRSPHPSTLSLESLGEAVDLPPAQNGHERGHSSLRQSRSVPEGGVTTTDLLIAEIPSTKKASERPAQAGSSSDHQRQISFNTALGAGKGVSRMVGAGLKSPMDFTLSLAKGFHNAPKLYGDDSVRKSERVTGFQSGLRAAGKGFGFGFYDGISGLVTQPMEGAKKEGMTGFLKGFAKGIGGVVLKPGAAVWGIPGYTFQGIYKELQKHLGSSVQNYIIAARTAQGYDDWRKSSLEERLDVVSRWHAAQVDVGKQKQQWRRQVGSGSRQTSFGKGKTAVAQTEETTGDTLPSTSGIVELDAGSDHQSTPMDLFHGDNDTAFQDAIRKSVTTTSRGNAEEDEMIEKAIRASVAELRRAAREGDDDEAIQRAIRTSTQVVKKASDRSSEDAKDEEQLQAALHMSMLGHGELDEHPPNDHYHDWNDSGVETEDDENIKLALANSRLPYYPRPPNDDDRDFQRALRQSVEEIQERRHDQSVPNSEDEIVLEYIKKQSLAEEELRRVLATRWGKSVEDPEVEQAMQESLKRSGHGGDV